MRPLRVKLIHRESDNYRKLTGWWSYPVPEFTWEAVKVPPSFTKLRLGDCDLVVMDDWVFGMVDHGRIPMAYVTVDSARSDTQLARNIGQALQADLILVDSDRLDKFAVTGKPVRRFAYAINEKLFTPKAKTFDVAFLCWPTPERRQVEAQLSEICKRHGWAYLTGTWPNPLEYAEQIGRARVVVHSAHVKEARSWRVFDVMATRGCLLTNPIPLIDGDGIIPGVHYWEYDEHHSLEHQLTNLLDGGWDSAAQAESVAQAGYDHVIQHHTWATRATQLRQMAGEVLGL